MKKALLLFVVLRAVLALHQAKFCYAGPEWYTKLHEEMALLETELTPLDLEMEDGLLEGLDVSEEIRERLEEYEKARLHFERAREERKAAGGGTLAASLRLSQDLHSRGVHPFHGYLTETGEWERFARHSHRFFAETDTAMLHLRSALEPVDSSLADALKKTELMEVGTVVNVEFNEELQELAYDLSSTPEEPAFFEEWGSYKKTLNFHPVQCEEAKRCVEANHQSGDFFTKCLAYYNNSDCVEAHEQLVPSVSPPLGTEVLSRTGKLMERTLVNYGTLLSACRETHRLASQKESGLASRINALEKRIALVEGVELTSEGGGALSPIIGSSSSAEEMEREREKAESMLSQAREENSLYKKLSRLRLAESKVEAVESSLSQLEAEVERRVRVGKTEITAELAKKDGLHPVDVEELERWEVDGIEEMLAAIETSKEAGERERRFSQRLSKLEKLVARASLPISLGGEGIDTSELEERMEEIRPGNDGLLALEMLEAGLHDKIDSEWKGELNEERRKLLELQEEASVVSESMGAVPPAADVPREIMESREYLGEMASMTEEFREEREKLEEFLEEAGKDYIDHLKHGINCTPQTPHILNEPQILRCSISFTNLISKEGSAKQEVSLPRMPAEKVTDVNVLSPPGVSLSSSRQRLTVKHYVSPHSSKTVIFEYLAEPLENVEVTVEESLSRNWLVKRYHLQGSCGGAYLRVDKPDEFKTETECLVYEGDLLLSTNCDAPVEVDVLAVEIDVENENATHVVLRAKNLLDRKLKNAELVYPGRHLEIDLPHEREGRMLIWKADIEEEKLFTLERNGDETKEREEEKREDAPPASADRLHVQRETLTVRKELGGIEERAAKLKAAALLLSEEIDFSGVEKKLSSLKEAVAGRETGENCSLEIKKLEREVSKVEDEVEKRILSAAPPSVGELTVPEKVKRVVEDVFGVSAPSPPEMTLSPSQDLVLQFLDSYEEVASQRVSLLRKTEEKARTGLKSANATLSQLDEETQEELRPFYLKAEGSYDAGNYTDALYWSLYTHHLSREAMEKRPASPLPFVVGAIAIAGGGAFVYKKRTESKKKSLFGELR